MYTSDNCVVSLTQICNWILLVVDYNFFFASKNPSETTRCPVCLCDFFWLKLMQLHVSLAEIRPSSAYRNSLSSLSWETKLNPIFITHFPFCSLFNQQLKFKALCSLRFCCVSHYVLVSINNTSSAQK